MEKEMKWPKGQHHEDDDGFPRLSSFFCDSDQDEPFSEQDLQAIEAIESRFHSSLPNPNNNNNKRSLDPPSSSSDPNHSHRRRRLPRSVIALQHPNAFSLSPCQEWQCLKVIPIDYGKAMIRYWLGNNQVILGNFVGASISKYGYSRMRLPAMKFSGQIMYSRTFHDVEKTATELLKIVEEKKREMMQIALGFDIEWRPTFKRGVPPGKVAVMQICDGTSRCYVLHLIHSGVPQNLQLLLEDPVILKVGAGIRGDAVKVFRDYNISIKGVEDLSFHANKKLGGSPQQWGLASLAVKLLSKQLKKPSKIRLGNWEIPVLSKEQLEYAATDAFASWYLYQAIKDLPDPPESTDKNSEVEDVPQQ